MDENTSAIEPTTDQVSFTQGNRFVFHLDGHVIEFWTSSFTGLETLTVDDKVISQKRNLRKTACHYFELNGRSMQLMLSIKSMLKGPVYCVLKQSTESGEWQPIAAKKLLVWPPKAEKSTKTWRDHLYWWLQFGFFFGIGVALSRNFGFSSWQFWVIVLGLAGLLIPVEYFYKRHKAAQSGNGAEDFKMRVEDISIQQLHAENV